MSQQVQTLVRRDDPVDKTSPCQPRFSFTAYGDKRSTQSIEHSFRCRMGRERMTALPVSYNAHENSAVLETALRRKTPSGTVNGGYDCSSTAKSMRGNPTKHLILHGPSLETFTQAGPALNRPDHQGDAPSTHSHQRHQTQLTQIYEYPHLLKTSANSQQLLAHYQDHSTSRHVSSTFIQSCYSPSERQEKFVLNHSPYGDRSSSALHYSSPIHEPPMNFINEHINELTLHDYQNPADDLHQLFHCSSNSHQVLRPMAPMTTYNDDSQQLPPRMQNATIGQKPFLQGYMAHFDKGLDPRFRGEEASSINHYARKSRLDNLAQLIPPCLPYPDHVINSARTLYASMIALTQDQRRKSCAADTSVHLPVLNNAYMFPQPSRTSKWNSNNPRLSSQNVLNRFCTDSFAQSAKHHRQCSITGMSTGLLEPVRRLTLHLDSHPAAAQTQSSVAIPPSDSLDRHFQLASNSFVNVDTTCSQHPSSVTNYQSEIAKTAWVAYLDLAQLCAESNETWSDAMLLAGCLAFALGQYSAASSWFTRIASREQCHVALSNLALTALVCNSFPEAELHWQSALKINPCYFEAAEHLVGLLCSQRRHKRAVEVIDQIRRSLAASNNDTPFPSSSKTQFRLDAVSKPGWTRLLGLVHAKGNILYSLHDYPGAAKAFEEAVLLALGLDRATFPDIVQTVLSRLSKLMNTSDSNQPILLSPEQALKTAQTCFGSSSNHLALYSIPETQARKAAMSTTGNSLLSLAKIYQDGMISSLSSYNGLPGDFGVREILAMYYLSLSLQPSPSTANNVGILLASVPATVQHSHNPPEPLRTTTTSLPALHPGSGIALAMRYYHYGLGLDSKHAHLYTNLGSLLKDIGQLTEAIRMYECAIVCDATFDIALTNLANAMKDQGRVEEAILYYKRAVEANPHFIEAVCGLANALNSICNWMGRGGTYINGGALDRWHVRQDGVIVDVRVSRIGTGWVQRVIEVIDKQLLEGETWGKGVLSIDQIDHITQRVFTKDGVDADPLLLYRWSGQKFQGAKAIRLLERVIKRVGWQWYQDKYVKRTEKPLIAYSRPSFPNHLTMPSSPTVLPFHTFTLPLTARQIRLISQRNGLRVSYQTLRQPWLPTIVFPPPPPPSPMLNIGYVSSDFNNHPLAHLMQNVFGMHDGHRVKAFCYATTAADGSIHRKKIEAEAPQFVDASTWSTERLVSRIVEDQIHVLVNLNGYTRGARNEVFAARPAPVQMSFMGFAGSLGAEWCDYLLADEVAVPQQALRPFRNNVSVNDLIVDGTHSTKNDDWMYGENIIYTRDSFFCCDHRQSAPGANEPEISWAAEQSRRWTMRKELFPSLDKNTIIFANFNQLYKIDPTIFRTWLRILDKVNNSILWLLKFPASGVENLLRFAQLWASPAIASRIIFTDVAPKHIHIARGCIADLFLDTPECNAHTTAADCLWSGTPILTFPRYRWKMCSRMAAGILKGALPSTKDGLEAWNELVVGNEEDYEDTAVRLASGLKYVDGKKASRFEAKGFPEGHGEGRLVELRRMIWAGRKTCALFDTKRWVEDLEIAYQEAWRRWVTGEGGDIWLKELL